jgi:tRNA dimethylallyltransferase
LYIDSVVFNYQLEKETKNYEYKDRELITEDIKELQKEIGKEILDKLNEGDRNNPRRLQKIIKSGLPSIQKGKELNHLYFFLDIDREILKERISKRVDKMFESGLLEENIMIREKNLERYPALQTIGYQEFDKYFEKEKSLEEVKEDIITHTNQYAKRQRTWFRRNMKVNYIKDYKELEEKTLAFISKNR